MGDPLPVYRLEKGLSERGWLERIHIGLFEQSIRSQMAEQTGCIPS